MQSIMKLMGSVQPAYILLALLLAVVAWTVPIWLGFDEPVQAGPHPGNTGWSAGQTAPTPTPTPVISAGVKWHGAKAWQDVGYKGRGIKVGIIDTGFDGFSNPNLLGKELPSIANVSIHCYDQSGSVATHTAVRSTKLSALAHCRGPYKEDGSQTMSGHGTRVSQVVFDIAPQATFYIANPPDDEKRQETVDWMIEQGVDVINRSIVDYLDAPGDGTAGTVAGTSHILNLVDRAAGTPVPAGRPKPASTPARALWVNGGGNEAQRTWYGAYHNPDEATETNPTQRWLSFSKDLQVEVNYIRLYRGKKVVISLRWDDNWGTAPGVSTGAVCDLDVYLHRVDGNTLVPIQDARSIRLQSGWSQHNPFETFTFTPPASTPDAGAVHAVRITSFSCTVGERPAWIQLQIAGPAGSLDYVTDSGDFAKSGPNYYQIGVPAESKNAGMLAVGAAQRNRNRVVISDSSNRGPTIDGRHKPDLVGFNCGLAITKVAPVTVSEFCGSSAAAPHVTGLAALLLQRYSTFRDNPVALVNYLKSDALQHGSPDPNNAWGQGFTYLYHPSGRASFTTRPTVINIPPSTSTSGPPAQTVSGQNFTVSTNIGKPPGVVVEVSSHLTLNNRCDALKETSNSYGNGQVVNIQGCTAFNSAKIKIYEGDTVRQTYTVRVLPPVAPPPTGLSLSTVSGRNRSLRVAYTRSQSPHRYQFKLEQRDLSARTETWTVVDTNTDSSPPETFNDVARGYHYRARGRNCQDTAQEDTCGAWSGYTNIIELSDPGIAISGLTGSYIAGDTDAFSVTLSDLTLDQPYTVTFTSSQSSIGFNYLCNHLPIESFAALGRAKTLSFTLHACQITSNTVMAQSGTITAQLRKGNARGAIVATATANATVTKATGSISPLPTTAFKVGHDQTFTLNTNVPSVYITATLSGDAGRLTLPTTQGCHQAISGRLAANGNTITIRGCVAGAARLTLHRTGSIIKLAEYTVTVNASTTKLSPDPSAAAFTVGHDRTFTVTTDIADDPGLWIGATYTGDSGRLTMPSSTQGCHQARSGLLAVNGNTITLRGCIAGTATLKVYRRNSSVHFATYTVTVNASTTKLSPDPSAAAFTVGHDRTFTVTTDIADDPGLWIGATYTGDSGRLTMPSSTQGCHQTSSGLLAVNGNTITLRGCIAGTATLKVYRRNSSVHFATYTVTVNASTTKLSPTPATFTAGHDQTFTVTTDIADNPGLWIGATYPGDSGRLTMPSSTQGCHQARSGLQAANGNTITLRGCIAGTATVKVYRSNSSVHFATYTVTVNASTTKLSPTPATFTLGTNQTFAVTTDIPNTPGLWIGFNYPGDTGRLLPANQSCPQNPSGIAAVSAIQGSSITLKPCTAGTVTIKVNRSYSGVTLVTYNVTVNSS